MIKPSNQLKQLPTDSEINLKDLGIVINENYIQYHLVVRQLEDLQNWIVEQIKLNKQEIKNGS